jgi:cytochrome c oxidase subunit II
MQDHLPLFPEAASSMAAEVDHLYFAWAAISIFFAALIALAIVVFFVKFRQRAPQAVGREPDFPTLPLELTWSIIPLIIALTMFTWGAKVFFDLNRPPVDSVDYLAVGKQWMWKFQHPEGIRETNDLHVPLGQAIRMTMTSQDVIHSLYLPAFRVKADVVPGRYSTVWFRATKPGSYHLFCAEYCGTEHSKMGGTIHVLEPEEYERWLASNQLGNPVRAAGAQLFRQLSCDTCHRPRGEAAGGEGGQRPAAYALGPDLTGLAGREVRLQNGRTTEADANYLRESILDPQAKVVAGWQPVMPTYRGQVTEEQVMSLVAYIQALDETSSESESLAAAPEAGAGEEEETR